MSRQQTRTLRSIGILPTRSRFQLLTALAVVGAIALLSSRPANAAPVAYYPFETDGTGVIGPTLTLGIGATVASGGMFGNALDTSGAATAIASVANADSGGLAATFTNFSASFWLKPDGWTTSGTPFITGKNGGNSARGWYLSKVSNRIGFAAWEGTANAGPSTYLESTALSLSTSDYNHIVATYSAGGTQNIYVNGILSTSKLAQTGAGVNTTQLNAVNSAAFEIGGASNSATKIAGNFDDYLLSSDFLTGQQIALIHGLGRFVGTSWQDNSEMANVLAAYLGETSAVAGGRTWAYATGLGSSIVGAIGGTVAGDDAFIVLNADGSGVLLQTVPEPASISLACLGVVVIAGIRRRKK
jgi:hypothetical protein